MSSQVFDIRTSKGMTRGQSNEHLRCFSQQAFEAKVSHNFDPSREQLNFEVKPGGIVTPLDKSDPIDARIKRSMKERGVKDPNEGLDNEDPRRVNSVIDIIFQGSRDRMRELAFGDQEIEENNGEDILTTLCGNAVKISEKMELVQAAFDVVDDTFGKMAEMSNKFVDTISQLINVLKGNALSISGVEDELDKLKREVHGLRGDISANKTSIDTLTTSVNQVKEVVKERETVTVYVPQTNVSQPWHERMVELSKMPVLKNPYFITLVVIILVQFGILFYTTSVVKEQRAEIASIKQDNSEIVKLYHRQSHIFVRIEKMDETVSKLAAEKDNKSSSGKKRR